MRVLILDNYDSFTFNLFQAVGELIGGHPVVHRNDAVDLDAVEALDPTHVVISPGPGHPDNPRDFGVCGEVIRALGPRIPILGVCLGHQGIVHHLGGEVTRAPTIVHGKMWRIEHDGTGVFAGLPANIEVMRYHSLIAREASLPDTLRVTARTADGLVMGVSHVQWPMHGVQFHPESIGTPQGDTILKNFLEAS